MDTATTASTHVPEPQTGLIDAHLIKIEDVARETKLFTFARLDGAKLPPYKPGAHIDLHLPNGMLRPVGIIGTAAPGGLVASSACTP